MNTNLARQHESAMLSFWRELSRALAALQEPAPSLGVASALYGCGYSLAQALDVLAPAAQASIA